MNDETQRGSGTGERHPSTGEGEGQLTGSGVVDSTADGGPGVTHDSRLGGGGPVGADIGGQGGTGASGNALPGEGPARPRSASSTEGSSGDTGTETTDESGLGSGAGAADVDDGGMSSVQSRRNDEDRS